MTATLIAREKNRVSLRLAFTAEELREACGSAPTAQAVLTAVKTEGKEQLQRMGLHLSLIHIFRPFGILSMLAAMIATGILFCLQFTGTAAEGNIMTIGDIPVGMIMIWVAVAIGGFTSSVSQSTFSAFWQSNTPREDLSLIHI